MQTKQGKVLLYKYGIAEKDTERKPKESIIGKRFLALIDQEYRDY